MVSAKREVVLSLVVVYCHSWLLCSNCRKPAASVSPSERATLGDLSQQDLCSPLAVVLFLLRVWHNRSINDHHSHHHPRHRWLSRKKIWSWRNARHDGTDHF